MLNCLEIRVRLHIDKVDKSDVGFLGSDRKLNGNRVAFQSFAHHLYDAVEIRAHDVHFVDISHTRNLVLVRLTPYSLRLRLDAALCAKDGN